MWYNGAMSILWGTRVAGQAVAVGDKHMIIGGVPDVIRTPPELGGQEFSVQRAYWRACPCGAAHESQTLELASTDMEVSECPARGFLWWRRRA